MLKNTTSGYGLIAILLHWLMALAIFGMFGLGLYMVTLNFYHPWYHSALETHKAIGVLVGMVLLARFGWRSINVSPAGLSAKPVENQLAHVAHMALYLLMAALLVSGYLISTADGRAIEVFGLFYVPSLIAREGLEDTAGEIHEVLAWTLIGLVLLHAAAALKHHFMSKDNTLRRMLRPGL